MLSRAVLQNVMAIGLLPPQGSLDSSHRNYRHCQEELFMSVGAGMAYKRRSVLKAYYEPLSSRCLGTFIRLYPCTELCCYGTAE